MTTPSHADIQTEALPLPVLTVSRWSRVIALLVAIALIGGVACLQFGSERIPLGDVARIHADVLRSSPGRQSSHGCFLGMPLSSTRSSSPA